MHLPQHSKLLKLQIALLVLVSLILGQRLFGFVKEETIAEDAQNGLVVQYVAGSQVILKKDGAQEENPTAVPTQEPEEETVTCTPTPVAEAEEETVSVATGVYQSAFLPECYPVLSDIVGTKYLTENLVQLEYLKENFYIVNSTTKMTEKEFDTEYFLNADFGMEKTESPQILIYHTHASEGFIDSRTGVMEDTVVGMGELLADILRKKYGYNVIHDTTVFDRKNGEDNRSNAYSDALTYMEEFLEENPTIEVIIDLHRDAGAKRVVTLQGEQVAKIMLFNGLSRNQEKELTYLPNKYLKDNLAFSFQMKLIGDEMYPGFMNRIFLKDYRYNMHLRARYLLIELGTQNNTVKEAQNAMEPLADVLAQVLSE